MPIDTKQMSEEQMMMFLRNAMVVAGHEMGEDGDHWPVIKSTVHTLMQEWEDIKINRDVKAEMKTQIYAQLEIMERGLPECTAEARKTIEPKIRRLRDIYDAYFEDADGSNIEITGEDTPEHLKRAAAIIETLEEEDA